jgi:hypothetical protein
VLALGPDSAYAAALAPVMSRLGSAQRSGEALLRKARSPGDQATAARGLSRSYADAAATAQRAPTPPAEHLIQAAILADLHRSASAYESLAGAATRQDRRGFDTARHAVATATQALATAVAQLRTLGYPIR